MTEGSFNRCQQEAEIELDQIDVGNCQHDLSAKDYTLVENVTEYFRQLDARSAKKIVEVVHAERSPTK
jgi:hypothetical protein